MINCQFPVFACFNLVTLNRPPSAIDPRVFSQVRVEQTKLEETEFDSLGELRPERHYKKKLMQYIPKFLFWGIYIQNVTVDSD
jgi:hypothetical protein